MPASSQPGDTGQGATLTLSSTTFAVVFKSLKTTKRTKTPVDVTGLSHTTKQKIPGDVDEWESVEGEFYWDTTKALPTIGGTSETGTVTWPLRNTETNAATLAGSGFFEDLEFPNMELGSPQMGKLKFCFNGLTPPAYTAAT